MDVKEIEYIVDEVLVDQNRGKRRTLWSFGKIVGIHKERCCLVQGWYHQLLKNDCAS